MPDTHNNQCSVKKLSKVYYEFSISYYFDFITILMLK